MVINRALLKHGYSNFTLEILEYCEPSNVIAREQFYLDLLCPEYNILQTAGSSLGFRYNTLKRLKKK
jgi:group I intron endonuclease